ncbi:MAG: glycosyltransferase family 2 protein [Lachnospiraceae bacterium]|nr:glycosyltransferase family 2 protein [Lachnospiraceae bacterium]
MTNQNGFTVQYDRFSLTEPSRYILKGYLAPGTALGAVFGGEEMPLELHALTENVDERYGGCEARAELHFGEHIPEKKTLRIYADGKHGRKLVFAITGKELEAKRKPIRVYLDDFRVSEKDGFVRIQGWAVAKEPVRIELFDCSGNRMEAAAERYRRFDTVELFDEYPVDRDNGFNIELRPIPKQYVCVRFSTGDFHMTRRFPTGPAAFRMTRAEKMMKKAADVLRFNGPSVLVKKTYDRLFNPAMKPVIYTKWIDRHLASDRELEKQKKISAGMKDRPLISIVVPCYRTPEKYLNELVTSVLSQSYDCFELILSDGSGSDSPITAVLDRIGREDPRIHVIDNGRQLRIAENTNEAIKAAGGEYILFADHDDILAPAALFEIAQVIVKEGRPDLIYTDEDKIGAGDKHMQPNMKPDYNPDFLCSVNYFCHIVCVKRSFLDGVGLLDPAYDGAQDYDFVLRCTEKTDRIVHIPKVLYHWRFFEGSTAADPESKKYAFEAGARAINAHYARLGWPAEAEMGEYPGIYRTRWHWDEHPLISVIIPNKDHVSDLRKCIESLHRITSWPAYEILVIENNSTESETEEYYRELEENDGSVRIVRYSGTFNFSAINNFGVGHARGEYLLFLNNDTEFITDALTEMMGYGMRPDVGAVGARLYYGDDTIQHAGVIVGWGGVAGHAFVNQKRGETGYQHRIICQQDLSAVTAACMLVRAEIFRNVGGFTEELAVAFNDIDLCMKIRRAGYLIVYNPFAELYHYESRSRGLENTPEKVRRFNREIQYFAKTWPEILRDGDPYYSPNLSMVTQDFSLKHI